MQTLGRKLWGDVWIAMFVVFGMGLALFVSGFVYSSAQNLWFGLLDLYILIAVSLAQNSKITVKQAIFFCIVASAITLAILAILIRL